MSKLTVELGLNTSSFDAKMTSAAKSVPSKLKSASDGAGASIGDSIGNEINSALKRKIGVGDVFRSFFGVIGLDAQRIANSIVESLFGGSLEAYRELSAAQDELGAMIEKNRLAMKDYAGQAAQARKDIAAAEGEMKSPARKGSTRVLDDLGNEIGTIGGETEAELMKRRTDAGRRREAAVAQLRAAEAAMRADERRQSDMLSSFNRAGKEESAASQIARLREESDALIALSRNTKLAADERRKYWEEGVSRATQARQAQRDLEKAERDTARQIAEVQRGSRREGMTERQRIADIRAEAAEQEKIAASAKTEEQAREARIKSQRLIADARKAESDLAQKTAETERRIFELRAKRAAMTETDEQSISRLRREAAELARSASDETRNQSYRDKDRIEAQTRLNEALQREITLRKSTLTIAEIAESGGTTARGVAARRALQLARQASLAEARGDFSSAEQYRSRGSQIEQSLLAQRRLAMEEIDSRRATALAIVTKYAASPTARYQAATRAGIQLSDLDRLAREQRDKVKAESVAEKGQGAVVAVLKDISEKLSPTSTK